MVWGGLESKTVSQRCSQTSLSPELSTIAVVAAGSFVFILSWTAFLAPFILVDPKIKDLRDFLIQDEKPKATALFTVSGISAFVLGGLASKMVSQICSQTSLSPELSTIAMVAAGSFVFMLSFAEFLEPFFDPEIAPTSEKDPLDFLICGGLHDFGQEIKNLAESIIHKHHGD